MRSRLLAVLVFILAASSAEVLLAANPFAADHEIRAVTLVAPGNGVVLTDTGLLRTDDDGATWKDITPLDTPVTSIRAVTFADRDAGYAVTSRVPLFGSETFAVESTINGGAPWRSAGLPFEEDVDIGGASVVFADRMHGWVLLRVSATMNTSIGRLFRTTDGGASWRELPQPPSGGILEFSSPLRGTISGQPHRPEMFTTEDGGTTWTRIDRGWVKPAPKVLAIEGASVTSETYVGANGWVVTTDGDCVAKQNCRQYMRLYRTHDGGKTFDDITPFAREARPARRMVPEPRPSGTANGGTTISTGVGFDACDAPSVGTMQTWWTYSPFYNVNVYYGGSLRGCPSQTYLKDTGWATFANSTGWRFIPTWVGPQASCAYASFGSTIGSTGNPLNEGMTEASNAASTAFNYGFGATVVYYDLEAFSTTDSTCNANVVSFIRGWVRGLHAAGTKAGVYMSYVDAHADLEGLWGTSDAPDAVWIVKQDTTCSGYTYGSQCPSTTFGLGTFSDSVWTGSTRLRQYWGQDFGNPYYSETWGGVNLGVDDDLANGPVTSLLSAKFAINDSVTAPSGTCIRTSPAGSCTTTTTAASNPGTIIGGSQAALLSSTPYNWWEVQWANGVTGWSAEALLTSNGQQTQPCYALSQSTSPGGAGYITVGNTNCTGGYTSGTQVSITANAYSGYSFSNWTSSNCTPANPNASSTTCTITGNASITANFTSTATPPTVSTGTATSITATSAQLNGTVNPNGNTVSGFFYYGLTSSYSSNTPPQTFTGYGTSPMAATVTGLTCGTTYHFAATATSTAGSPLGSDNTFTTSPCATCSVNVTAPSGGERLSVGKTFTIKWSSSGSGCSSVTISLYRGTTFIQTIASNVANGGSYLWTLSGSYTTAADYLVRIDAGAGSATSNASFAIGPPITPHDYNSDSRSDVILQNSNGSVAEWQMNGFSYGGTIINQPPAAWKPVASGDFNGDGIADLLLQNTSTGDVAVWLMSGNTLTGGAVIGSPGLAWKVVGAGDADADGKSEIFLQNQSTGDVAEWKVNGLTLTGGWILSQPGGAWKVAAVGDFDGDGRADLVLQNTSTNDIAVWLLAGSTLRGGAVAGTPAAGWNVVATGDFSGTGKSAILLRDGSGNLAEWQMDGLTLSAGWIIGMPGSAWVVKGTGDFNGDGRADVLLQNTTNGYIAEWQMNGSQVTAGAVIGTPGTAWSPVAN